MIPRRVHFVVQGTWRPERRHERSSLDRAWRRWAIAALKAADRMPYLGDGPMELLLEVFTRQPMAIEQLPMEIVRVMRGRLWKNPDLRVVAVSQRMVPRSERVVVSIERIIE